MLVKRLKGWWSTRSKCFRNLDIRSLVSQGPMACSKERHRSTVTSAGGTTNDSPTRTYPMGSSPQQINFCMKELFSLKHAFCDYFTLSFEWKPSRRLPERAFQCYDSSSICIAAWRVSAGVRTLEFAVRRSKPEEASRLMYLRRTRRRSSRTLPVKDSEGFRLARVMIFQNAD